MTTKIKKTKTDALVGNAEKPVENMSTTVNITGCESCTSDNRQFVTRKGITTLRCKVCDSEVDPLNDDEAQSLADYNK